GSSHAATSSCCRSTRSRAATCSPGGRSHAGCPCWRPSRAGSRRGVQRPWRNACGGPASAASPVCSSAAATRRTACARRTTWTRPGSTGSSTRWTRRCGSRGTGRPRARGWGSRRRRASSPGTAGWTCGARGWTCWSRPGGRSAPPSPTPTWSCCWSERERTSRSCVTCWPACGGCSGWRSTPPPTRSPSVWPRATCGSRRAGTRGSRSPLSRRWPAAVPSWSAMRRAPGTSSEAPGSTGGPSCRARAARRWRRPCSTRWRTRKGCRAGAGPRGAGWRRPSRCPRWAGSSPRPWPPPAGTAA
ncbi:MAG: hypothetical protein AVDCRST_MAG07-1, partial [uncultured Frankineae bacterium]